jgi:TRAP-type C4-dicarboxylate transport system permease small subunit
MTTTRKRQGSRLQLLGALDRCVWWALAIINGVMSLAIFVQVVCRFAFGTAIVWAEEFAVLLFAWMIFIGAAYAQRNDSHLSIDTARAMASPKVGLALDAFRLLVIAACSIVAIWEGVGLAIRVLPLLYPAMEITRAWLYAGVPVGFGLGLIYMVYDIYGRFTGRARDEEF